MPQEKATSNRQAMPNVADIVDAWKSVFPDLRVSWAKDKVTGIELGQQDNGFAVPWELPPTPVDTKQFNRKGKR